MVDFTLSSRTRWKCTIFPMYTKVDYKHTVIYSYSTLPPGSTKHFDITVYADELKFRHIFFSCSDFTEAAGAPSFQYCLNPI